MGNTIGIRPNDTGVELTIWEHRLPHSIQLSPTQAISIANGMIREALNVLRLLETDQPFQASSDGTPTSPL